MATFENCSSWLEKFSGKVRLFPLPNLVMFPHVLQPLHVFEPRYRAMIEEAIAQDGLIAMAVLAPGWEKDYEGRPAIHRVACLGQIASYHRLKDGSYNVLLLGLRRVRLVRELAPDKGFREAQVELCEEEDRPEQPDPHARLREHLLQALTRILPMLPQAQEQLDQLLAGDVPLAVLADIVSYMLDIDLRAKEALLAELDVRRRVELLLEHLAVAAVDDQPARSVAGDFLPGFSPN